MRVELEKRITDSPTDQVDLQEMEIQDHEIEEIAKLIVKTHPDITNLFMDNNAIGDEGAVLLGGILSSLKKLNYLDLQFNQIDRTGMLALVKLKENNSDLKLALHGNKINSTFVMKDIEDEALKKGGSEFRP